MEIKSVARPGSYILRDAPCSHNEARKDICYSNNIRNITQRKNAEKALIESRERLSDVNAYLETIINASPFAIVDLYPDGRVKSLWNPAAENIFGWKSEEVLGNICHF